MEREPVSGFRLPLGERASRSVQPPHRGGGWSRAV